MSFDLGVWYPQKRISNKEASELYVRLCENDLSGVVAHSAVDQFYAELIAAHPEIDTIPDEKVGDVDYCPWSCKLDRSPGHVIMSCVLSQAGKVGELVDSLADKYALAVYDPQSVKVTYPEGTTGARAESSAVAMSILGFFGLIFSAMFVYSGQIDASGSPIISYVVAGLCLFMAAACFRQALRRSRNQ